jgi:uncharacterized protein
MILIDSNIPMYLVGAPHKHKTEAQILVEQAIAAGERLATDAEVIQEILHRFTAINRRQAIPATVQLVLDIVDEVLPVEKTDVLRAAEIVQHPSGLSARDAIHIAIMERHGIRSLMSFDADFDRWPGLRRVHQV